MVYSSIGWRYLTSFNTENPENATRAEGGYIGGRTSQINFRTFLSIRYRRYQVKLPTTHRTARSGNKTLNRNRLTIKIVEDYLSGSTRSLRRGLRRHKKPLGLDWIFKLKLIKVMGSTTVGHNRKKHRSNHYHIQVKRMDQNSGMERRVSWIKYKWKQMDPGCIIFFTAVEQSVIFKKSHGL